MNKFTRKLFFILVVFILIIMNCLISNVYALTQEEQELIQILTEYKDEVGDLNEFKNVIDQAYDHISSATIVDDSLKAQLTDDISKLEDVTGINPLILNVLEIELTSHIANLTDENLNEVKQEFAIIKSWIDSKIADTSTPDIPDIPDSSNNVIIDDEQKPSVDDTIVKDDKLPQTGKTITILLVAIFLIANSFICIKKYKQYKQF